MIMVILVRNQRDLLSITTFNIMSKYNVQTWGPIYYLTFVSVALPEGKKNGSPEKRNFMEQCFSQSGNSRSFTITKLAGYLAIN